MAAKCPRKHRLLFEDFPRSHNLVLLGQHPLLQALALTTNEEIRSRITYSVVLPRLAPEATDVAFTRIKTSLPRLLNLHILVHVRQPASCKHDTAERDFRCQVRRRERPVTRDDEVKCVCRSCGQARFILTPADHPARGLARYLPLLVQEENH